MNDFIRAGLAHMAINSPLTVPISSPIVVMP